LTHLAGCFESRRLAGTGERNANIISFVSCKVRCMQSAHASELVRCAARPLCWRQPGWRAARSSPHRGRRECTPGLLALALGPHTSLGRAQPASGLPMRRGGVAPHMRLPLMGVPLDMIRHDVVAGVDHHSQVCHLDARGTRGVCLLRAAFHARGGVAQDGSVDKARNWAKLSPCLERAHGGGASA
jgi:hypothetical protein